MSRKSQLLVPCVLALTLLTGSRGWGQTLFYATSSAAQGNNTVQHVTPDGVANASSFTASGSPGNGVSRCSAIALDVSLQKVFVADAGNRGIWSMNLDGTDLSPVRTNLTGTPVDLALDTVNQRIYYATSSATQTNNTIQRVDYSGSNNTVLFLADGAATNPVSRCTALALDLRNSRIFFADAGVKGLWSLNLDGSDLTLIRSNLTAVPLGLALDLTNQMIYYVTSSFDQDSNTVQRINYTGTGNSLLFTATGPSGNGVSRCTALEFDPAASRLYLADGGANALWSLNADGTGLEAVLPGLVPFPRRVRLIPLVSHFTVVNLDDSGPGSLRDAVNRIGFSGLIDFSNTLYTSGPGTVQLATVGDETFGPSALVISNQVVIAGPMGTNGVIIARSNGAPAMRLFYVGPDGVLSLKNLTLTNGLAQGGAGGSGWQRGGSGGGGGGIGGAIFNWGALDLENSTLVGNRAVGGAGGGYATNTIGLGSGGGGGGMEGDGGPGGSSTTGGDGGGPTGGSGGTGTASGSSGGIGGGGGGGGSSLTSGSGSGAGGRGGFGGGGGGGGAYNSAGYGGGVGGAGGSGGFGGGGGGPGGGTPSGAAGLPGFGGGGSALSDGTGNIGSAGGGGAGLGGAIFNLFGRLAVTNCTFSGNQAVGGSGGVFSASIGTNGMGFGGGIFNGNGTIAVLDSTFAFNRADQGGGGIYNLAFGGPASAFVRNTILAYTPSSASDYATASLSGAATNLGNNNLIQANDGFAGGIVTSADPRLGPLVANGGPTLTHVPLNGSPAINAGDNSDLPPTDQRGYPRITDATGRGLEIVDIGAVEDGFVRLRTVPQTPQDILLNGFKMFLTGESNRFYVIQSSTNLTVWKNVSTNQVPATELPVFDTSATTSRKHFYRARSIP